MWLVLLVATSLQAPHTLAATTYNLPLLQETLEVIGGDIFMGINNILNGAGGLKGMVQDRDPDIDVMDVEDQLEDTDDEVEETDSADGEGNVPAEEKTPESSGVEITTVAPTAAETESTVEDGQNDDEDEDEESPTNEDKPDENKSQKDIKTDDDIQSPVKGETKTNEQQLPTSEEGGDDVEAQEVPNNISNFVDDEDEEDDDDEAKNLASAFVNLAAQKIRDKLEDLQI